MSHPTNRQIKKETNKQTNKQTNQQKNKQTTDKQTDKQTVTYKEQERLGLVSRTVQQTLANNSTWSRYSKKTWLLL